MREFAGEADSHRRSVHNFHQEAAMPKRTAKDQVTKMVRHVFSPKKTHSPEWPSREVIERRAYELYLARGGANGSALEDWLQAERELQH
jgi:Protein of unknown function (DUF2934)